MMSGVLYFWNVFSASLIISDTSDKSNSNICLTEKQANYIYTNTCLTNYIFLLLYVYYEIQSY